MDTKVKTQAKDFFNYFGALITLLASSGALITLWFSTINKIFVDNLYSYTDYSNYALRASISTLIVAMPLYFFFLRSIRKTLEVAPEKKEIWVRKWITYLTAFLAGASVAGNLIVTINIFLSGEITARFALKALTVFLIGGGILFYYAHEIRETATRRFNLTFAVITAVVTVISFVVAFAVIGSPAKARMARFDQQRTQVLYSLNSAVRTFYVESGKLPESMKEITSGNYKYYSFEDPETNEPLVYRKLSSTQYELCAEFNLDTTKKPVAQDRYYSYDGYNEAFGIHKAGVQCFTEEAEANLYKPSRD